MDTCLPTFIVGSTDSYGAVNHHAIGRSKGSEELQAGQRTGFLVGAGFSGTFFAGTSLPMLMVGSTDSAVTSEVHHLHRVAPSLMSSRQCGHFTFGSLGCNIQNVYQR